MMPRPESERTLMLRGLDDVTANRAMTAALGSPFDVSGAAHVPNLASRAAVAALADLGSPREAVTLLRLEGITASAAHRAAAHSLDPALVWNGLMWALIPGLIGARLYHVLTPSPGSGLSLEEPFGCVPPGCNVRRK